MAILPAPPSLILEFRETRRSYRVVTDVTVAKFPHRVPAYFVVFFVWSSSVFRGGVIFLTLARGGSISGKPRVARSPTDFAGCLVGVPRDRQLDEPRDKLTQLYAFRGPHLRVT